ncbi:hypothetical protein SynBIOSE41_03800 [Synechococcus sp. BIOS-E4-1]|nr:hypothetical protein SynBIOSE41_03800 [Synechococcus sp. BIOS-E4-1]
MRVKLNLGSLVSLEKMQTLRGSCELLVNGSETFHRLGK